MKRTPSLFVAAGFLAVSFVSAGDNAARTVRDVLQNARNRDRVLIQGKISRAFDFDTFLISDNEAQIAVSFVGVKQNVQLGDPVLVYGKYTGRSSYMTRYGLIEANAWARMNEPAAAALIDKYGVAPSTMPAVSAPASVNKNVESRLNDLDALKAKKLISDEEYKEQRHRILNDL